MGGSSIPYLSPQQRARRRTLRMLPALALLAAPRGARAQEAFSFFLPTPESAVMRMLALARVTPSDLVLDLGSGDGRIVIAAARAFGARGWGVDLNPDLVARSMENARRAGVVERVRFEQRDVLQTDMREASVVTIYLLPNLLERLRDKLLKELKPGARVVVYEFAFENWPADEAQQFFSPDKFEGRGGDSMVRLWIVPADVHGRWRLTVAQAGGGDLELEIAQNYQKVEGVLRSDRIAVALTDAGLRGSEIEFAADLPAGGGRTTFSGRVADAAMQGTLRRAGNAEPLNWHAQRVAAR